MSSIPEIFGSLVFNDTIMKKRLPKDVYASFTQLVHDGQPLTKEIAGVIANEMKDWAIEKGVTHYTHWFQPMTGITAEKHDSFITPTPDGNVIMNFSGKELIKGEPDASSFPNGGLRSTFEARGYTAWDPTQNAFIKDGTLCIPTAFGSYSGQVLDKKTPLMRSTKVLEKQVRRILACFGKHPDKISITVGAEQEYFLIDKNLFLQRKDLIFTGRTLFGAHPPKGQELEDHYFGNIRPRVIAFMSDLDNELWKLGILAKTRHNEAAPSQHELAPIFSEVNNATDHNQLTMECMKKIAEKHNLACLLHEKPFDGVNGSGKHNNWSIAADDENIFSPGKNPQDNLQFLLFLSAVIRATDDYQDLLRLSVASAGNEHRLGGHEAPPAIISMYLGDELISILESIDTNKNFTKKQTTHMNLGVDVIPSFKQDTTDRNRTSPIAFTGNKFEFRMIGSTSNIACPNTIINTSVAEALDDFATRLEKATDIKSEIKKIIHDTYNQHKRILFNGNNYSEEWVEEAKKRGLLNISGTPEALCHYSDDKNVALFEKYNVYTRQEIQARQEILLENYCKVINIEGKTLLEMVNKEILPACFSFMNELSDNVLKKAQLHIDSTAEKTTLDNVSCYTNKAFLCKQELADIISNCKNFTSITHLSNYCHDTLLPKMQELRGSIDMLETLVAKKYWTIPSYSELLFSV